MLRYFLLVILLFIHSISQAQQYAAEMVLQKTQVNVRKGRLTKQYYFEIRINDRTGERFTEVSIPFSKTDKLINIDAYIKDSNDRIIKKIKKSDITESSDIAEGTFYQDEFEKKFILKHNVYPYTLVYSYEISREDFLIIEKWIPVINTGIPTRKAQLEATFEPDYGIRFSSNGVKDPLITSTEGEVFMVWETDYTIPVIAQTYAPGASDYLPGVFIAPIEFRYDIPGTAYDWKSFGAWQSGLLTGLNDLPDTERRRIISITKDIESESEKIRALYHFLQDETRYINISIETGGIKPYPASYVAKNKYGDCKALTNYFKSMLEIIGIESYYTKVFAGSPVRKIIQDIPSQQFNHIILFIPLENGDIWLDCTSDAAFGYLGTFTQNREAFIIDGENSRLVKTPALDEKDVTESRSITIGELAGSSYITTVGTYRGNMYENLLSLNSGYNSTEIERIVKEYFSYPGHEVLKYEIMEKHRDTAMIGLKLDTRTKSLYKRYGKDIIVENIPFSLPQFESPNLRTLPVQLDFPICKIDTLIYEIPGRSVFMPGESECIEDERFGEYRYEAVELNGKIRVNKYLLINSGTYPPEQYREFYDFINRINESEKKPHITLFTN